jgi:hypothetical protein
MLHRTNGSATTSRQLKDVARRYLAHLEQKLQSQPRAVVELWSTIAPPAVAGMTRAVKFEEGILYVHVSHSAVLSLLHEASERKRLVDALQQKIPEVAVRDISFRIGTFS